MNEVEINMWEKEREIETQNLEADSLWPKHWSWKAQEEGKA